MEWLVKKMKRASGISASFLLLPNILENFVQKYFILYLRKASPNCKYTKLKITPNF